MKEQELERVLKALANRRRLAILRCLKYKGRKSVGDIAQEIKLSFKATSKHLMILANVDILEKEQISLVVLYGLSKSPYKIVHKIQLLEGVGYGCVRLCISSEGSPG